MENFEEMLKHHYETRELTESRVSEILQSCAEARVSYRWKRLAIGGLSVAAASLMTLGGTGVMLFRRNTDEESPSIVEEALSAPNRQELKLVAVRIYAEGCARSQQLAPVFAALQKEFVEEPVLFITFDYSSKSALHQTRCLSRVLGIEKIFNDYRKTGSLVVASPDGVVRDVVDSNFGLIAATEALRHNL